MRPALLTSVLAAAHLTACARPAPPVARPAAPPPAAVALPSPASRTDAAPASRTDSPDAVATISTASSVIPASNALLLGRLLFVIDPDGLGLRGVDITTGVTLWRSAAPERYAGLLTPHELVASGLVLLHAGDDLHVIDPATGALRHTHTDTIWNRADSRTHFWERAGACALVNESCRMQPVDCETARPLGERIDGPEMRIYPDARSHYHDTGCWGHEPRVIGRAGDVLLYYGEQFRVTPTAPSPAPATLSPSGVIALDARTGAQRYAIVLDRREQPDHSGVGIGGDGRTCWHATTSGAVHPFDCATGRLGPATQLAGAVVDGGIPGVTRTAWVDGDPPGIYVAMEHRAYVLDATTRALRWSRAALPAFLWPLGMRVTHTVMVPSRFRSLEWVSARDGTTSTRVSLEPYGGGDIVVTREGAARLVQDRATYDSTGRSAPPAFPHVFVVEHHADHTATVTAGGRAHERLPFEAWSLGEVTRDGVTHMAMMVLTSPRSAEVRLLRHPR